MTSKKMLRYLNGTTTFVFLLQAICINIICCFPTRAALYLNDLELSTAKSALLAGTSSPLSCHKDPDVSA